MRPCPFLCVQNNSWEAQFLEGNLGSMTVAAQPWPDPERLFPTPGLVSFGSDVPPSTLSSSESLWSGFSSGPITHQPAGWVWEGLLAALWNWVPGCGSLIKEDKESILGGLRAWPASPRGLWCVADPSATVRPPFPSPVGRMP